MNKTLAKKKIQQIIFNSKERKGRRYSVVDLLMFRTMNGGNFSCETFLVGFHFVTHPVQTGMPLNGFMFSVGQLFLIFSVLVVACNATQEPKNARNHHEILIRLFIQIIYLDRRKCGAWRLNWPHFRGYTLDDAYDPATKWQRPL